MIVTFCGHRDNQLDSDKENRLREILRSVLQECPDAVFYLGGYGCFDAECNVVLKELQAEFPALRRIFVTPYLDPNYSRLKDAKYHYDEVLYPFDGKVMLRFAISKRNRWMVQKADLVIAHINHGWGGAAKTLCYAEKLGKRCVNIGTYTFQTK